MPTVSVVHGDITMQDVDVIVNAANRRMRGGGGVDGAIHHAGGPAILQDCIKRFPTGLDVGAAGSTTAGELPARWVIHTVGPDYTTGQRDRSLLESCYRRALAVADELEAESIAFPLISAGRYGWPQGDAIAAAVATILTTETKVKDVRLVAYDSTAHREIQTRLSRSIPVRILQGVRVLHRRGHHDVRVAPGMSASGMHWRVAITTADNIVGSHLCDHGVALLYSTGGLTEFAGMEVHGGLSAEIFAGLIWAALPDTTPTVADPEYVSWFAGLLRLVEQSWEVPIAYADYFEDADGWEIGWGSGIRYPHPPPGRTDEPAGRAGRMA